MDEVTRKKIEALLAFLREQKNRSQTARRLSEVFQLDPVIVRALAADEGIMLRDTGEVPAVDPSADTQRMHMPHKPTNGKDEN